ncbi:Phage (Mu-like) virion morphogenesis protein [Methylophaga frappieri]|uniref:Phage (Mu-like) virion morphogenesis protein n=1 Tax=Methylophaga frappieri (strain ATCC BAA-2434 / DSM 25690 / JAM7) TaxID=754477 RepID=I1YGF8_METFJ|nr:PBECR2 nuclease fold domain-containing protein [Methylophaga frappieri]AFJ02001.1 Phage (Mu-like) virion morphogenesis protein [Methylophaga frappieri]
MPSVSYGSVPFQEQQNFFRRKLNIPTRAWTDIYNAEHDWAFMVAGANRDEIVADFRESIDRMIEEGLTIEEFRKDFDRIVAEHGWDYNGGREWRSRVIYETNLRTSYAAGRLAQLNEAIAELPYWEYHHSGAEHPRLHHLSWDGLIIAADDPWWQQHYPPNGWGCGCYVTAHSEAGLREMGKTPDEAPNVEMVTREIGKRSPNGPRSVDVPKGIDPGFEYAPGRSRIKSAVPPPLSEPPLDFSGAAGIPNRRATDVLPLPRAMSRARLLPDELSDVDYAEGFLGEFGASLDESLLFDDVIGHRLAIGPDLFRDWETDELITHSDGHGPYLPLIGETIRSPDEIWTRIEQHGNKMGVWRRYLSQFLIPGQDEPALVIVEWGPSGWKRTILLDADKPDPDSMRFGVRLYRRSEEE